MSIEYYTSRSKWYWRLRGSDGLVISRSERGFASKQAAADALKNLMDNIVGEHYTYNVTGFTE